MFQFVHTTLKTLLQIPTQNPSHDTENLHKLSSMKDHLHNNQKTGTESTRPPPPPKKSSFSSEFQLRFMYSHAHKHCHPPCGSPVTTHSTLKYSIFKEMKKTKGNQDSNVRADSKSWHCTQKNIDNTSGENYTILYHWVQTGAMDSSCRRHFSDCIAAYTGPMELIVSAFCAFSRTLFLTSSPRQGPNFVKVWAVIFESNI